MENIRKKLLLMKTSFELTLMLRITSLKLGLKKNYRSELPEPDVVTQIVEEVESNTDEFEIETVKHNYEEIERQRMMEDIKKGQQGICLLFRNPKFLMALLTKRSDIIALIIEQYHIEGKITDYTVDAILTNGKIKFNEEEKNKLSSLITTPIGFGAFGLS